MQSRLASNLLCPQEDPWISGSPVSVFHVLGLQVCAMMPGAQDAGKIESRTPCILGKHSD